MQFAHLSFGQAFIEQLKCQFSEGSCPRQTRRQNVETGTPIPVGRTYAPGRHNCKQWDIWEGGMWFVKRMGTPGRRQHQEGLTGQVRVVVGNSVWA